MKTTITFEINRHQRAAIRTYLASAKSTGPTDNSSVKMFIEQSFQAALQNLMYQRFIEQAFRDAHENPTRVHACAKLSTGLGKPGPVY